MAYEFLKKFFGTPKDGEEPKAMTYAELEAAIDADKKIQVVDVKAGGYVSKEKLDAKITELDGVKQQLSDANTTIQSYKDMDIDGIKQSAKDWETKYTQETQKLTAQLAAQERTHALDMFMGGYKFSSKPAENGVRAEFEKKNFTLEDGKFLGGDEFMKSLMENDDYKGAFVIEDDSNPADDSHEEEEGKPFFARGVGGTGGAGGEGVKGKEAQFNPFGFNLIRQPEEQKFPEMNAYCISKLYADWTTDGTKTAHSEALTEENVLTVFDEMMKDMDNKRVPRAGRILYVTPDVRTLINNAKQIYRTVDVGSRSDAIKRAINSIDDVKIPESVPSDMMQTKYDFTEGWKVDSTAKQINMVLVHPMAVITPISYEFAQLDPPSAGSQGKYDYFEESFEDVFILPHKMDAIDFHVNA